MNWREWFATNASKLPFDLKKQNELTQASPNAVRLSIAGESVRMPVLGQLTELENWMLQILWSESNKVEAAFNLKKITLIDKCIQDTGIETSKVNQFDILTLLNGGIPDVYQVLEWAIKNTEVIGSVLNHDYIVEARMNQYRRACILLSSRVDCDRDWPGLLLNSPASTMDLLIDTLEMELS
jgi:hypothetical protein